jgi:hypothetical protein
MSGHPARRNHGGFDPASLVEAAARAVHVLEANDHLGNSLREPPEREMNSSIDKFSNQWVQRNAPGRNSQFHGTLLFGRGPMARRSPLVHTTPERNGCIDNCALTHRF